METLNKRNIILGSASIGRRNLCEMLQLNFHVQASEFPEDYDWRDYPTPADYALTNARQKSLAFSEYDILITADTVVLVDGEVIEKPENEVHAKEILRKLSGKTHAVVTGLVVKTPEKTQERTVTSYVEFREIPEDVMDAYVRTEKWRGKCAGYGVQDGETATFMKSVQGCYYNVVGLPVFDLAEMLLQVV